MNAIKIQARRAALVWAAALGAGCVDTGERMDEFFERSESFRGTGGSEACGGRHDVSGEFLLAVGIVVNPAAPIVFDAALEVDEAWGLTMTLQPLAVADRAPVGEPLVASGSVGEDGAFALDFGQITIVGEANAILPGVPAVAELTLKGCTVAPTSVCGEAAGEIVQPVLVPLAGSTFGAVPAEDLATQVAVSACVK